MCLRIWSCLILMSLGPLFGQGTTLVGAGYSIPTNIRVAPGQIIKLFISGTKTVLPPQSRIQRATTVPLPTTLAGFSVNIQQGANTYAAPLLSVEQAPTCADANSSSAECFTTALTVQIPFEIVPMLPGPLPAQPGNLIVNDNGTESQAFNLFPLVDNLHVITGCDKQPDVWLNVNGFISSNLFLTAPCNAVATHADGSLVSADSPAKPGEVVVIYAFGLGKTSPPVKTGEATPTPAPILSRDFLLGGINPYPVLAIQLDFRLNAGPSRPFVTPLIMVPAPPGPAFMGLTPGQVGLYQINVKLPDSFPLVLPCTGSMAVSVGTGIATSFVQSNLTIDIGGASSFDGAAICVQPIQ